MPALDEQDRKILNRIQSDFPTVSRPWLEIARELQLTEEDVLERVKNLKALGMIRRIGGNFPPDKLGYVSTLCAAAVPDEKIETFTAHVNQYAGVTHNYQRDHYYNIWFTFIEPSLDVINANLTHIKHTTGVTKIINLPAIKVFKVKAHFDL